MSYLVPPIGRAQVASALSPVFENTAPAGVSLGSLASRSQCGALTKQGIGPYTMSGTDASSGDPYSYVTNKNYTQPAQMYESGEADASIQSMYFATWQNQAYADRSGVLQLYSSGNIGAYSNICNGHATYGSAFGPEIWTEAFPANAGQALSFDWAAAGGGDDYESYGYLVKVQPSANGYDYGSSATSTLVAYGRGQLQGWTTSTGTIPSTGHYRFRFINGTYDATGGKVLGASMYIDTVVIVGDPSVITFSQPSDIIRAGSDQTFNVSASATSGATVSFSSNTTSRCSVGTSSDSNGTSTATVTVLANQTGTCSISANSGSTGNYIAASTVTQSFSILQGAIAPTTSGGTSISGDIGYGETITANDGTWGDGGSAITSTSYQWQSCNPSSCSWTNISGATSSSYTIGLADVGNQIRVEVTKTNSIGSLTANSSASATVPAPTFINVTNLLDDGSTGSLRWAINTANASQTINTINFDSNNTGTITLTSDLPAITEGVSITGNGMTNTIIDGDNLYRAIYNNGQRNIVINDMTFKQGKNTTGGIAWVNQGTLTVSNVKFTASQGYAWYQQNGTVTSFNNCQFTYLSGGISSDHGSTPSAKSLNEADYTNRVYINNSLFTNNGTAVGTERFVKVVNSTFTNNGVALQLQGLNRQQVLNSTFTDNSSAVYMFSWMPTQWAYGTDNQLVEGNTFTRNTSAINFNNYFNNGSKTYNDTGVNSWSTARNNTFDDNGTNVTGGYGIVEDTNTVVTTTTTTTTSTTTTSTTTTTVVEVVLPPIETPPTENTTVSIPDLDLTPVSTPEPEVVTTPISPPTTNILETIFEPVDTPEVDPTPVVIPEDPTPEIIVPKDTQDAADAAVEDIFDGPMSNAGLANAVDDLVADAETPEALTAVVNSLLDQELTDTQFSTVIDSVFDGPMSDENFSAAVDAVFADTSALSDEQFDTAVQAVFDGPLSTEQFSDALEAIFSEPISDEKFDAIIDAVLDEPLSDEQFAEVVGILESDAVTEEQVAAAVDSILENEVTAEQATDLATSEKVLESIDGDQAAEIFDAVAVDELTSAEEAALVEAVTNAPEEVKNAFEETINVYGEGLDDYVPVGSSVDVGSRRTLLAASAALTAATVGMGGAGPTGGSGGGSGGSGGGSGGSGGGPGDGGNRNGRKEDENPDGEEEDTEIEGPEDQEDNHFTRNSIFKYEEETMKRRFSPWGFIKKLGRETSALAFTISGSVVVFATLSGETRKITIIATGCAFAVHYIYAMIKNDED
jgi:hypothetical protein